jgi:5-methylcytosine-specific restriction protein A
MEREAPTIGVDPPTICAVGETGSHCPTSHRVSERRVALKPAWWNGRHRTLRTCCLRAWGFESLSGYIHAGGLLFRGGLFLNHSPINFASGVCFLVRGAWAGSTRRERLPLDWRTRRAAVLARDRWLCQWVRVDTGTLCGMPATDVDHIIPGDDHDPSNLQALCRHHHARKSAREGGLASHTNRPTRGRERGSPGDARQAMLNASRERET